MQATIAFVPETTGFNYRVLDSSSAEQIHAATDRIRQRLKLSIESIIAIGNDLMAVKLYLDHGQFGSWLRAEFGWTDRTARNLMSVAERFGKKEMISDLAIQPTAAYLLAAPSVPEAARELAIQRATAGERITTRVAREILAEIRKKSRCKARSFPSALLAPRLQNTLAWYRQRWNPNDLAVLKKQLEEFLTDLSAEAK